MENTGTIQSRDDFKKNPKGQYSYWSEEIQSAKKRLEKWHQKGDSIIDRYLSKIISTEQTTGTKTTRLNLFHSNMSLVQAMLFGNLPKVDVSRKYADQHDDVARVASEIAERMLNLDIQDNSAEYDSILRAILQDRLLPGLGCARVRYDTEFSTVVDEEEMVEVLDPTTGDVLEIAKEEKSHEELDYEDATIEYYHWRDVLWGWSRTWSKLPWLAFRTYLTKDQARERFGKKVADKLIYKTEDKSGDEKTASQPEENSNWQKTEIWEIWDKEQNEVVWWSHGFEKTLDKELDPLQLDDFYPTPPFLLANPTTTLYMPTPDYVLSEDLYNEIDILQTRIAVITEAVRVIGLYDSETEEIARMFKESKENDLIPVSNWAMFAEKGGLPGGVSWFPIEEVVKALRELIIVRDQTIELLYQITGFSDILRGGGTKERESATAQGLKAKFGSARLQGIQDQFATYVGSLMNLKLEVISKHYDADTIIQQSNIGVVTADAQYVDAAVALIMDPDALQLRVTVQAESLAMVDFAQKKQERTEFMVMLSNLLKTLPGFLQIVPNSLPAVLEMLQWSLAGFKGAQSVEGVLDKAIAEALNNPAKPKDDGGAAKAAADMQKLQLEIQRDQQKHQNAVELENQRKQNKLEELMANLQADLKKINAKMTADVEEELQQSEINAQQTILGTQSEAERDALKHEHDMVEEEQQHENKMDEIAASKKQSHNPGYHGGDDA